MSSQTATQPPTCPIRGATSEHAKERECGENETGNACVLCAEIDVSIDPVELRADHMRVHFSAALPDRHLSWAIALGPFDTVFSSVSCRRLQPVGNLSKLPAGHGLWSLRRTHVANLDRSRYGTFSLHESSRLSATGPIVPSM
jgi:hypothetical protein